MSRADIHTRLQQFNITNVCMFNNTQLQKYKNKLAAQAAGADPPPLKLQQ